MNAKLYVGNLDYSVTSQNLEELFSEAGEVVEATVITDKYSGRSKGFGFVQMKDDKQAKKALEMFNEKEYKGRTLRVDEARPRKTR